MTIMTVWKWLKINVAAMLIILAIPWIPTGWKHIELAYWKHIDPAVTEFMITPSGDQFYYLNPDLTPGCDGIVPAAIKSYGYKVPNSTAPEPIEFHASRQHIYVNKAITFRVVKQGVIGESRSGYYVIDTTKRQVYISSDKQAWQKRLTQMGIDADVECHPLPIRKSYINRGWLSDAQSL